jgi:hypothetical protein
MNREECRSSHRSKDGLGRARTRMFCVAAHDMEARSYAIWLTKITAVCAKRLKPGLRFVKALALRPDPVLPRRGQEL